ARPALGIRVAALLQNVAGEAQRSPVVGRGAPRVSAVVQVGMPGGPRISMPYSAAVAANRSRLGGSVAGGGIVRLGAGSDRVRMKASKPAGSVTSRKRASDEVTVKVWGMSRGPYTNDPAGASMSRPPTQKLSSPSVT